MIIYLVSGSAGLVPLSRCASLMTKLPEYVRSGTMFACAHTPIKMQNQHIRSDCDVDEIDALRRVETGGAGELRCILSALRYSFLLRVAVSKRTGKQQIIASPQLIAFNQFRFWKTCNQMLRSKQRWERRQRIERVFNVLLLNFTKNKNARTKAF
jgi:hypothetical protein